MGTTIIFLIGIPASGKSTIGKIIASECNFTYLDKDVVCNNFTELILELKGYAPYERDQCSFYRETVMDYEYKTLLDIANDNLRLGKSVVVDAPFIGYFSNIHYIEQLRKTYNWKEVTPLVVSVTLDFDILKDRLVARSLDRDRWKHDNWDTYIKSVQDKQCLWKNVEISQVDNSNPNIDVNGLLRRLKLKNT